ncbi:MAG: hypothetical protein LQ346_008861 [Caloplaca aetnensis]|nr:MAG: hypothetical protein LQ346_008861 [Caloplaca aetnensis]
MLLTTTTLPTDDGTCAIDIIVKPGAKGDVITGVGISRAAKAVIDSCVAAGSAIGGEKINFTPQSDLLVTVRRYDPAVTCHPATIAGPDPDACARILGTHMSASTAITTFQRGSQGKGGTVHIPYRMQVNRCSLSLRIDDAAVSAVKVAWFDIWAAGVAINELCGKKGLAGSVSDVGKSGDSPVGLEVELMDAK